MVTHVHRDDLLVLNQQLQLERHIRSSAADSSNVAFVKHAWSQRLARHVNRAMVMEVLRLGRMYSQKSGKVPRWADKLVRLLYAAHSQGNEPICRVMDRIKTVERIVKQRIVVQEKRGHWTPSRRSPAVMRDTQAPSAGIRVTIVDPVPDIICGSLWASCKEPGA